MCRESWRDKESHTMRLVTITVLSIIPIALMVLTATGYFYTTLRLSGRWIETVYLVIIWNLLYQTVLRGLSVAARRIAAPCTGASAESGERGRRRCRTAGRTHHCAGAG